MEYIYKEETYKIRGCLMKVYNELGSGYLEKVYQEALEIEFSQANIPYQKEAQLNIMYKGHTLKQTYIADFFCFDKIIVELKAVSDLTDTHRSQVINYLKTTNQDLGILVNFGAPALQIERLFNYHKQRKKNTHFSDWTDEAKSE